MIELFLSAAVTLFVVIDPAGCAPIFAGLTRGATPAHRREMAVRAVVVAAVILLLFALFGKPLLRALGISLDAFRLAGGIMLFLIALEMVFERSAHRREEQVGDLARGTGDAPPLPPHQEDVSVFPMGVPMIAGPGSIATTMLLMSRAQGLAESLVVLAAVAAILLVTLATLVAAGPLLRVLGQRVEAVITRILGVLLAALAVQFVINAIHASFP